MAEQAGLEPTHRERDERISNPLQYRLCLLFRVAGADGFEPPHAGIKTPCLTAWRCPNVAEDRGLEPLSGFTRMSVFWTAVLPLH